eukprot:g8023.t1
MGRRRKKPAELEEEEYVIAPGKQSYSGFRSRPTEQDLPHTEGPVPKLRHQRRTSSRLAAKQARQASFLSEKEREVSLPRQPVCTSIEVVQGEPVTPDHPSLVSVHQRPQLLLTADPPSLCRSDTSVCSVLHDGLPTSGLSGMEDRKYLRGSLRNRLSTVFAPIPKKGKKSGKGKGKDGQREKEREREQERRERERLACDTNESFLESSAQFLLSPSTPPFVRPVPWDSVLGVTMHVREAQSCPCCFEDTPKGYVLPCGHGFCLPCLLRYVDTTTRSLLAKKRANRRREVERGRVLVRGVSKEERERQRERDRDRDRVNISLLPCPVCKELTINRRHFRPVSYAVQPWLTKGSTPTLVKVLSEKGTRDSQREGEGADVTGVRYTKHGVYPSPVSSDSTSSTLQCTPPSSAAPLSAPTLMFTDTSEAPHPTPVATTSAESAPPPPSAILDVPPLSQCYVASPAHTKGWVLTPKEAEEYLRSHASSMSDLLQTSLLEYIADMDGSAPTVQGEGEGEAAPPDLFMLYVQKALEWIEGNTESSIASCSTVSSFASGLLDRQASRITPDALEDNPGLYTSRYQLKGGSPVYLSPFCYGYLRQFYSSPIPVDTVSKKGGKGRRGKKGKDGEKEKEVVPPAPSPLPSLPLPCLPLALPPTIHRPVSDCYTTGSQLYQTKPSKSRSTKPKPKHVFSSNSSALYVDVDIKPIIGRNKGLAAEYTREWHRRQRGHANTERREDRTRAEAEQAREDEMRRQALNIAFVHTLTEEDAANSATFTATDAVPSVVRVASGTPEGTVATKPKKTEASAWGH